MPEENDKPRRRCALNSAACQRLPAHLSPAALRDNLGADPLAVLKTCLLPTHGWCWRLGCLTGEHVPFGCGVEAMPTHSGSLADPDARLARQHRHLNQIYRLIMFSQPLAI